MTTYLKDLQNGLHAIFESTPEAVLIGEDILDPYGGAFKVSMGLSTKFKDRVITSPISEASIIGVANGLALRGMRPIAEIMFGDFLTLCADQIINHATKFTKMYNGRTDVPLIIRTPMGGGRGYGPTHSQSLEKLFLGVPNIKVVAPSHFHSPGTILSHIVKHEKQPVLFIEHKLLYPQTLLKERVSENHELPGYPTAIHTNYDDRAERPDVTLIAYGGISRFLEPMLKELELEEIRILCVIPSSIKPFPINAILESVRQTGKVVIAEEGTSGFNWGSEIASLIYEGCFGDLTVPIKRVASDEAIIPTSTELETKMLVSVDKIRKAIFELL